MRCEVGLQLSETHHRDAGTEYAMWSVVQHSLCEDDNSRVHISLPFMFRMCKHGCPTGTDLWVEMIRGLGGLLKAIVFDGHCGPFLCVCVVGVADVLQIWTGTCGVEPMAISAR